MGACMGKGDPFFQYQVMFCKPSEFFPLQGAKPDLDISYREYKGRYCAHHLDILKQLPLSYQLIKNLCIHGFACCFRPRSTFYRHRIFSDECDVFLVATRCDLDQCPDPHLVCVYYWMPAEYNELMNMITLEYAEYRKPLDREYCRLRELAAAKQKERTQTLLRSLEEKGVIHITEGVKKIASPVKPIENLAEDQVHVEGE